MLTYKQIGSHFAELSAALLNVDREELKRAIETLREARKARSSVWIVGNGGSAATASHFANDLVKMAGIKAFAVPDMGPTVFAYGNDDGWDKMFQHTIDVYLEPQDVVVAISCSGKSVNVLMAANSIQNLIILTGNEFEDNYLSRLPAKAKLAAMSDDITIQEDIHLAMCHAIAKGLRE